jgi:hypothetical protein
MQPISLEPTALCNALARTGDADKSVSQEGNGNYIMKPVLKVQNVQ